jgi:hypothetical protein
MDAIALHDALGGDERAVLVGHDWGAATVYGAAGHAPERWRRVVAMAVPPGGALAHAFVTNLTQLKRSWYMFFFQHPLADLLVGADDLALVDMLWRDWSPGFDATEELALLKPSLRDPAHLAAAVGYYRPAWATARRTRRSMRSSRPRRTSAAAAPLPAAPATAASAPRWPRWRGRWCPTTSRSRSSTAAATSSTSSSRGGQPPPSSSSRRDRPAAPARRPRRGREAGLRDLPDRRAGARRAWPADPSRSRSTCRTTCRPSPRWPRADDTDLAVSWHHDIETVPTLLRISDGEERDRTVGWSRRVGGADRPDRSGP